MTRWCCTKERVTFGGLVEDVSCDLCIVLVPACDSHIINMGPNAHTLIGVCSTCFVAMCIECGPVLLSLSEILSKFVMITKQSKMKTLLAQGAEALTGNASSNICQAVCKLREHLREIAAHGTCITVTVHKSSS